MNNNVIFFSEFYDVDFFREKVQHYVIYDPSEHIKENMDTIATIFAYKKIKEDIKKLHKEGLQPVYLLYTTDAKDVINKLEGTGGKEFEYALLAEEDSEEATKNKKIFSKIIFQ